MAEVSDLRNEANALLRKAARAVADSDDLLRWFNECRRRLQRRAKLRAIWTLTLTGDESYSLDTSSYPIYRLDRIYHIGSGATQGYELDILPLHERWISGVRFLPALPSESAHTLYVWPDTLEGSLEIHGERRIPELTGDDDIPAIPEDFHDLFPLFAACRYGGQDEDFGNEGRFQHYEREYLGRESEFILAMNSGEISKSKTVRLSRRWD